VSPRVRSVLCVLGASFLFAMAAGIVKALGPDAIPTIEVVFFRSLLAALVLLAVLPRHGGWAALHTRRPWDHAVRTGAGFFGMLGSFYGYARLPIATVTAINFAMPLVLTGLSVLLLRERVGWQRGGAVLAGLLGVLIVVQPWSVTDDLPLLPMLVVLGGVVAWAVAMIGIRRMGRLGERNVTIVLIFSLGCTALSGALTVPVWVAPQGWQWAALIGLGLTSAAAQLLMTEGYRTGETTLLAPFEYGAIIYATALGAVFWGEWPDWSGALGVAVLILSGLLVWPREEKTQSR
jgi:drug/metabolite transporter (DMT)-like permease